MQTFVPDEVVTAAKLNLATQVNGAFNEDDRTYTNTGFLDLDALTGGSGSMGAVAVTLTTGAIVWVFVTATLSGSSGVPVVGYRVSGATTLAASTTRGVRREDAANQEVTCTYQHILTGLTPGSNTFELQALVTAGTGRIIAPSITVHAA